MLSSYRILDLTDHRGHLAGHILASLGADVIAIEPPCGSAARRLAPFVDGEPGLERSLVHFAYNRGKRSVVLELGHEVGREQFLELVAGADAILESADHGELDELGLGVETLLDHNPALVVTSISPFGRSGPKAGWPSSDLTVMAASCALALTGDADRAPLRISEPQGHHFAAASGACGTIMALLDRARTGLGQRVEGLGVATAAFATQGALLSQAVDSPNLTRTAGGAMVGDIALRLVYPAADGHVSITHVFGPSIGPVTARLMAWVCEEGFCSEEMRDKDWVNYAILLDSGEEPMSEFEAAKAAIEAFTSTKTKAELLAGAMERRLVMAPISNAEDVYANEHFAARGYLEATSHRSIDRPIRVPGAFAKCSVTPLPHLAPAPALGEHTDTVLAEPRRRPDVTTTEPSAGRALSGLRVVDFTWSLAGPHFVRSLADHGADVIKIESSHKPDGTRGFMPIWNNEPGPERSALFDDVNVGKRSLTLDMTKPEARDVVRDLVALSDVVIESYSPRAMPNWGLDYEHLRAIKPDLVMLSTCLFGQYGPLSSFAGYGNLGAALAGFYGLGGWPDRPPAGPFGAYTDYTSTHVMLATVLAAIDHRRRTGEGQYIDIAQAEAAMQFLVPTMVDFEVNGELHTGQGNDDRNFAPHGVYPTKGDDRWIAVVCETDAHWIALCETMGRFDLVADPALAHPAGRLAQRRRLDEAVAAWTADATGEAAEFVLIRAGVPAHRVLDSAGCLADEQLAHYHHFVEAEHPERDSLVENTRFRLSRTGSEFRGAVPTLGEHTFEILTEVLGYDGDRIADLAAAEVLE